MSNDTRETSVLIEMIVGQRGDHPAYKEAAAAELNRRIPAPPATTKDGPYRGSGGGDPLPSKEETRVESERRTELIETLIAMVRRAGAEMPGRVLRATFEADLEALLKEHGIEAPKLPPTPKNRVDGR